MNERLALLSSFLSSLGLANYGLIWLMCINFTGYSAMIADKRRAETGQWRIPERRLLFIALLGGSLGTLTAQQLFRHKTRKQPFRAQLFAIAALQICLSMIALTPSLRKTALQLVASVLK